MNVAQIIAALYSWVYLTPTSFRNWSKRNCSNLFWTVFLSSSFFFFFFSLCHSSVTKLLSPRLSLTSLHISRNTDRFFAAAVVTIIIVILYRVCAMCVYKYCDCHCIIICVHITLGPGSWPQLWSVISANIQLEVTFTRVYRICVLHCVVRVC